MVKQIATRRPSRIALLAALAFVAALAGCGVKGPLQPPPKAADAAKDAAAKDASKDAAKAGSAPATPAAPAERKP